MRTRSTCPDLPVASWAAPMSIRTASVPICAEFGIKPRTTYSRAWSLISSWILFPTVFPNPRVTHTASGSLMRSRPSPVVASPMIVPALVASATTSTPIKGTVWPLEITIA